MSKVSKAVCNGGTKQNPDLPNSFVNEHEYIMTQKFDAAYRAKIVAQFEAGN